MGEIYEYILLIKSPEAGQKAGLVQVSSVKMKKNNILMIGRDPQTLQGVVDILKENGYDASGKSIVESEGMLLGGVVAPKSVAILV